MGEEGSVELRRTAILASVNAQEILTALDAEIARLQQARGLISRSAASTTIGASKKRTLSPDARKKIAAAQRKRWAKQKAAPTV
jgi:hypothetical protein